MKTKNGGANNRMVDVNPMRHRPLVSRPAANNQASDDDADDDYLIIDRRFGESHLTRRPRIRPSFEVDDGDEEDDLLRLTQPQTERRREDRRQAGTLPRSHTMLSTSHPPDGSQATRGATSGGGYQGATSTVPLSGVAAESSSPSLHQQKRPSINFRTLGAPPAPAIPSREPVPPHSADSHASTAVPHSPVGIDSHYGSDTIHSNLSRYSTPDCGVSGGMSQSPGGGSSSSSPNPSSLISHSAPATQARRTSSHVSSASLRGVNASTTSTATSRDKSGQLAWHELEPLDDVEFSNTYWQTLLVRLDSSSEWLVQSNALADVRRIAMHHSEFLSAAAPTTSRRCVSVAQSILTKVLLLAENLRSAVAKNAILTLNDLFLFADKEIECPAVADAILLCLKKASSGGQFLIEEAERTWRQIILVSDVQRTLTTLGNALSKLTKSSSVLKSKCINAVSFFCLRLDPEELKSVCDHKDFPTSILKTVFKSISDSHPECRTSAARCLIVLINLIPGLLQKFRYALQDIDMNSLSSKIKRWDVFDIKQFYGISSLEESYRTLPVYAPVDRTTYRLQLMIVNVDLIIRHPLPIPQSASSNTRLAKEISGVHKMGNSKVTPNNFSSHTQRANSAVPFVSRAGYQQAGPRNGPNVSTVTQIRFPTPSRDLSAYTRRDQWNLAERGIDSLGERGIDLGSSALFKEEGGDEDEPWTLQQTTHGRNSILNKRTDPRDLAREMSVRTPPRSRTPLDLRAVTPLGRDSRSSTRPRVGLLVNSTQKFSKSKNP